MNGTRRNCLKIHHEVRWWLCAAILLGVVFLFSTRPSPADFPGLTGDSKNGVGPARAVCPTFPACPGAYGAPLPPGVSTSILPAALPKKVEPAVRLIEGSGMFEDMVLVPSGAFRMGTDSDTARVDESPSRKLILKDYYIAKHEVTVAEYCRFLNDEGLMDVHGRPRIALADKACQIERIGKEFKPKSGMDDLPVVCVSWYGASDYAKWAGGRLPTAAEWEKAAALTALEAPNDFLSPLAIPSMVPVAQAIPGRAGIRGMIGNVWEWCNDWYAKDLSSSNTAAPTPKPASFPEKELRGGSWASTEAQLRISNRHRAPPAGWFRTVGFRIVKE